MEYTLAEKLPLVLEDKTTNRDYVNTYQPVGTPWPSLPLNWPQLIIPLDSQWRRILERLANPLYGRDILNKQLNEMALSAPDIAQVWRITEKLPPLTDLLDEERNNE